MDFDEPDQHKALDALLAGFERDGIKLVFIKIKRAAVFIGVPDEHHDAADRAIERMMRGLGMDVVDGGEISAEIADEDRFGEDLDAAEIDRIERQHHPQG
jgi:hypothetical protein